jgi:hypothetical protein
MLSLSRTIDYEINEKKKVKKVGVHSFSPLFSRASVP